MNNTPAKVGIIMGSQSDWPTLEHAAKMLTQLGIPWESKVVSAHRTPKLLYSYAETAAERGIQCIIAGAGGAAHLPGMAAAITPLPVLAVPVKSSTLNGVDSLLSIVQMPAGIPTATFAIGVAGAKNAALFAAAIFAATGDETIAKNLNDFRANQTATIMAGTLPQMSDIEAQQS
jgi:5-(carboxyamino)imidazole ribonucleotide mutase